MSRSQTTQTGDRNSSSNTKLYSSSLVVNLTRSWQTWVTESDGKQASEPSGRVPACQGEPAEEPKNTWSSRKETSVLTPYPHPGDQATAVSQNLLQADPRGNRKTSPRTQKLSQDGSTRTEGGVEAETSAVPVVESHSNIKTKQVVKTVSTGAQEKGAGIGFLRVPERITEEPSREEIDKMLNQQSSPTRSRKCSNTTSPLTKSWKQVEKERKPVEDDEHVEAVAGQNDRTGSCIETEHNGSPEEDSKSSSVRWVKRPSLPMYRNKDAEDASKINALSKKYSAVGDLKSRWQNWSSEHTVNQKLNPFSEEFDHEYSMSTRLHKGQEGYGRPKEGTMTAERAKRAEQHIHREVADMCYVIRTMKDPDKDGKTRVTFKELFDQYVRISDKVVGILMRARKHGKVAFEGEMLWQGQDDAVIITLLV